MKAYSVGSSSSGNSYIIQAGQTNLLVDVGLSATKIVNALENCGIDPADVKAVLITHEHIDHVRSLRAVSKKCPNARFYASQGTVKNCTNFDCLDQDRIEYLSSGECRESSNGDVTVRCFGLSHDAAEPIGYSIIADGEQLTIVTDTGVVTEEIYKEMLTADTLIFEANHEESLLMYGDYPYNVKMRIKSDVGHLSNVSSGELLARLLDERSSEKAPIIALAHLSEKNNTPYQARVTIESILKEHGYTRGDDYALTIAAKEGICEITI